ncbi:MAG: hypothetical protein NT086_18530 [Proteobacteria bacterium]|jgi:hypothetical protein|nr:hypothetical protein [Pseudomonadota bacterium]
MFGHRAFAAAMGKDYFSAELIAQFLATLALSTASCLRAKLGLGQVLAIDQ